QVYADLVFNHNSGGDAQELNPIDGRSRWTRFEPKSAKFPRDWKCFHPSRYETWDGATFGDMPDLCHRAPLVYTELISYARWLRDLAERGVLMWDRPAQAVTFVENHDVVRDSPIINDKLLAYAFILTHEGYPCVFWQDYFNWNLAQPDNQSGIDALIKVHEQNAAGPTQVLFVDNDLYVMQRLGAGVQYGLALVLNNRGAWNG